MNVLVELEDETNNLVPIKVLIFDFGILGRINSNATNKHS